MAPRHKNQINKKASEQITEKRRKWLDNLQVGDKVLVSNDIKKEYTLRTVYKKNDRYIYVQGLYNTKFRMEDGCIVLVKSFMSDYLQEVTDKVMEKVKLEEKRRTTMKIFNNFAEDLTSEELDIVVYACYRSVEEYEKKKGL